MAFGKSKAPSTVTATRPSARMPLAADTTSVGLVALGRAVVVPSTTTAARIVAAARGRMNVAITSQASCRHTARRKCWKEQRSCRSSQGRMGHLAHERLLLEAEFVHAIAQGVARDAQQPRRGALIAS